MIVYLRKYFIDGHQIGDTLVYRTKRAAMAAWNKAYKFYSTKYPESRLVTNLDHSLGNDFLMRLFFKDAENHEHIIHLSKQTTED